MSGLFFDQWTRRNGRESRDNHKIEEKDNYSNSIVIINAWDASCMISSSNKFAVLWIAHNTFILHYWYLAMSVCSRSCQISHAHFLFFKLPTPPPFPFQTSNVYFRSLRWALFPFRTTRTRRKKDTHIQRNQRFHLLEYLEGVVYDLEGWSSAETCIKLLKIFLKILY